MIVRLLHLRPYNFDTILTHGAETLVRMTGGYPVIENPLSYVLFSDVKILQLLFLNPLTPTVAIWVQL